MLVLSRKREEGIVIGHAVKIRVLEIRGDKVRLGIDAPRDVAVHREEIELRVHGLNGATEIELEAVA